MTVKKKEEKRIGYILKKLKLIISSPLIKIYQSIDEIIVRRIDQEIRVVD